MANEGEHIVGYFPVLHKGYLNLFAAYPEAPVGILGVDVLSSRFNYLRKDIRALPPEVIGELLAGIGRSIRLVGEAALSQTMNSPYLVMPDDDVSRTLAEEFHVTPKYASPFLRWDRQKTAEKSTVQPDRTIVLADNDPMIQALYNEAARSPNWWRHVAAALLTSSGQIASISHNDSEPTQYSSSIDGDPRITARRGEAIELSIDIHAEARLIAESAKHGHVTNGASIFVTTFPCANCAKLIVESGIRNCYFIEGYANIDGQSLMKTNDVEIIKVETRIPPTDPSRLRPY